MVAKIYFEPEIEGIFHPDSYGYRPNKSALDAVDDTGDDAFNKDKDTVGGQDIIIDDERTVENDKPAVKVLSENSYAEVLKMVADFRENQPAIDPNESVNINLSSEFAEILSQGPLGLVN